MRQIKIGDTVKVHYTGKLEDGTVFDKALGVLGWAPPVYVRKT